MEYKALKDIAKITMGQSPDSSSYNEAKDGLPFFQGNADFGELYPNERVWCNEPKKVAEPGDILISVRAPIGALNYAKDKCCIGRGLAAITIEDEAERNYVFHLLKARNNELNNKGTGSTFKAIGKSVLEEVSVPQISREEQQKCMDMMDSLESIIRERQAQLNKLDELIKARFVEMFGEVQEYINITEIAHTYIGLVTTMTTHYCDEGTPLLFNSSIRADKIIWDGTYLDSIFAEANKSRMHKTGDIITVHTGDIGTSAVIGEDLNNSLGFATIVTRVNDIGKYNPQFISSFLNYGSGKEQLQKYSRDVRNNLNLKDYNRLMIPNVSISLQNEYVNLWRQVDKSKVAVQKALDETQLLFDSLMQEYFG